MSEAIRTEMVLVPEMRANTEIVAFFHPPSSEAVPLA
jgi:hypothetical protein